ncbi:VOC family protein [Tunturibacter psychrotolerans]|uniref:VOC family protein n=1 Tax=Tunturiibacter psychrotolerans TaxID=3069686 RepID=A0AAU7ZL68_9BACT
MAAASPLFPYLVVPNGIAAIEFYKKAFGAVQQELHLAPGTERVMNACLSINGGIFMLSDDFSDKTGEMPSTPEALHGSPVVIHLQVDDVDAAWERAVAAGGIVVMPLADQFWGDRYGQLNDPFGHRWSMAQRKVVLTKAEIEAAAESSFKM